MRADQLTFTRFIAAVSIVVFHFGKGAFPFNLFPLNVLFQRAELAVSYFFVLSGFVMVLAYSKSETITPRVFFLNRLARIYPAYLLALLGMTAFHLISPYPSDFRGFILNVTMIQSWIPGYALSFNGPGWSLSVELFFYLFFPFLFNWIYKRWDWKHLLLLGLGLFLGSQFLTHFLRYSSFYKSEPSFQHDLTYFFPLMHWHEFILGSIGGLLFLKGFRRRNLDFPILILSFLLALVILYNKWFVLNNGLLILIFLPLILFISANTGLFTKLAQSKWAVFMGEISYGMYIYQLPVFLFLKLVFKELGYFHSLVFFYSGLVLLIVVSAMSYRFVEQPVRFWIKKRYGF